MLDLKRERQRFHRFCGRERRSRPRDDRRAIPRLRAGLLYLSQADLLARFATGNHRVQFTYFGHDQVVLHEREIRKDLGDFAILRDRARKAAFLDELTALIDRTPMTIIASAIRKDLLVDRYAFPNNPYKIALGFGLERIARWLKRQNAAGATPIIVECRGKREDDELELEFRRICAGENYRREQFSLEPRFVPKSANVPGLQIADLVARPIARHIMNATQTNRAYTVIDTKFDRSPSGSVLGWGLKIFP